MASNKLLSICIPTWNRSQKLDRLLGILISQIKSNKLDETVEVVVSDNGSVDDTPAVCLKYANYIHVIRHQANIGFDANCLSIFMAANTPYVLFFSDDDLPESDLLKVVLDLAFRFQPAVLLYSFLQNPYDEINTSLPIKQDIELVADKESILYMLINYPKLSTFCIRRAEFRDVDFKEIMDTKVGTGYLFLSLAAKAYLLNSERGVILHRRPLASADAEVFKDFRFSPLVWSGKRRAVDFPEFWQSCPHILLNLEEDDLRAMLLGAFQHESGKLTFESNIRREIYDYLLKNRYRLLYPKYYKLLIVYFGVIVSKKIGLQKAFIRLVDWVVMFKRSRSPISLHMKVLNK